MTEMIEPDRTIMIVSIVGLVVIWGSFFYHKYLQDDVPADADSDTDEERQDSGSKATGTVAERDRGGQGGKSSRAARRRAQKRRR